MKLLLATDFNRHSGYESIAESFGAELTALGNELWVLGKGYEAWEQSYPFHLIPSRYAWLPQQMVRVSRAVGAEWTVLMMDVPKALAILRNLEKFEPKFLAEQRIAMLFPVESGPIVDAWAYGLRTYPTLRFTFTEFGMGVLQEAKLPATLLPVGLAQEWNEAESEEVEPEDAEALRKAEFVLTVAANQFRKNFWGGMQMVARLIKEDPQRELYYVAVTEPESKDGWDLQMLARQCGLPQERYVELNNLQINRAQLRWLYRHAGALLLPSMAEGIGMPLYEARACGCPVVATACCAIPEAVADPELLVRVEHSFVYAWGNVEYHFASIKHGAECLRKALTKEHKPEPVRGWQAAAVKFCATLVMAEQTLHQIDLAKKELEKEKAHVAAESAAQIA